MRIGCEPRRRAAYEWEPAMKNVRFVGLDVHAETIAVAVAEPGGEVRSLGVIPNRAEPVRRLIGKLGKPAQLRMCYEQGLIGAARGARPSVRPTSEPVSPIPAHTCCDTRSSGDCSMAAAPSRRLQTFCGTARSTRRRSTPSSTGGASAAWHCLGPRHFRRSRRHHHHRSRCRGRSAGHLPGASRRRH